MGHYLFKLQKQKTSVFRKLGDLNSVLNHLEVLTHSVLHVVHVVI